MTEDTPSRVGAEALLASPRETGAAPPERRERLKTVFLEARDCTRCPQLVAGRTQVVFGSGNADADLMFVAEAPGAREDEQGTPLVGAIGKLLTDLLATIGLAREDVFVAHVLKCRPPGNRDPAPSEIDRCLPYLREQVELIQPRVICTLGDMPTRLIRGEPAGIRAVHGRPEVVTVGSRAVHLLPLFHPAAGLYTRALLDDLREDMAALPELLARPLPEQPAPAEPESEPEPAVDAGEWRESAVEVDDAIAAAAEPADDERPPEPPEEQLGLF